MKLLANLFLLWMSEAQHSTKTLRNVKTKYEHMHRAAFMRRRGGCDQWSPYSPGQASADRSMGDQQNPHPPQDSKSTYQGGNGEKGRGGEPCTWRPSAVTLGTQTLEIHCGNPADPEKEETGNRVPHRVRVCKQDKTSPQRS